MFLPPLISTETFSRTHRTREKIEQVVFVGNDMIRKDIGEYLAYAKMFPSLIFHVVGRSPNSEYFELWLKENPIENLKIHGELVPKDLNELLDKVDLHLFTSKSEGFGKVTIELAKKGIPTILYSTYGANEWLQNGKEGIIVNSTEEFKHAFEILINDQVHYAELERGCLELAKRFDVNKRILDYEKAIEMTYNEK